MFFQEQGIYICIHTHIYTGYAVKYSVYHLSEKVGRKNKSSVDKSQANELKGDIYIWLMRSDSTMISDLAVCCRKNQPHWCPSTIWVLQQQLQWTGFLSHYLQLFPAPCFSKMVFWVDQHNWFGDVLKPNSVNWSEFKIFSHSPFFPSFFAGFLFSYIVFPVHLTMLHHKQVC